MRQSGRRPRRRWIGGGVALAVGGFLGVALAWGPRDPNPPARFSVPVRRDQGHGFAPDGQSYLIADAQETTTWDLSTGRATTSKSPQSWGKSPVSLKAYSRDRRRFAGWSVADQAVVWGDAATGAIQGRFPVQLPEDMILPRLAWVAGDRKIELVTADPFPIRRVGVVFSWDLDSGIETKRTVQGPGQPSRLPMAYAPDDRTWVYFEPAQDTIRFWDSEADQPIGGPLRPSPTLRHPTVRNWPTATFTPDGRTLIVGRSDGQAEFWDVATRHLLRTVQVLPGRYYVHGLQLSPDGRTLVTSGFVPASTAWVARASDRVRQWLTGKSPSEFTGEFVITDLRTDRPLARYSRVYFGEFSPDGRRFATDDPGDRVSIRDIPPPTQP